MPMIGVDQQARRPARSAASRGGPSHLGSVAMSRVTTDSRRWAAVPQLPDAGPTGTSWISARYSAGREGAALGRSSSPPWSRSMSDAEKPVPCSSAKRMIASST